MSRTVVLRCHQRPRSLTINVEAYLEIDGHLLPGSSANRTISASTAGVFDWVTVVVAIEAVKAAMIEASQPCLPLEEW